MYEKSSGLVSNENIVPISSSNFRKDWTRERLHDGHVGMSETGDQQSTSLPIKGSRSLSDAMVENVLQNLDNVTLEGIQALPDHIVLRMWSEINHRHIINFHNWLIWSKLLEKHDSVSLDVFRYIHGINDPDCPLSVYVEPLTSINFDFLTYLSISAPFPLAALIKLSEMRNLAVLEITNPDDASNRTETLFPRVGDRLIRAWSDAADQGAFPVLRILKLYGHPELTNVSLRYLNSFPALGLFDVKRCSFTFKSKQEAKAIGWLAKFDPNPLALLEAACIQKALGNDRNKSKPLQRPHDEFRERLPNTASLVRDSTSHTILSSSRQDPVTVDLDTASSDPSIDKTNGVVKLRPLALEAWEFQQYTSFARLGELRNDEDLGQAGIAIGGPISVKTCRSTEIISPKPMACLRLGKHCGLYGVPIIRPDHRFLERGSYLVTPFEQRYKHRSRICVPVVAFFRVSLVTPPGKSMQPSPPPPGTSPGEASTSLAPKLPAKHGIPAKRVVRDGKKRRVGNLLDSFN